MGRNIFIYFSLWSGYITMSGGITSWQIRPLCSAIHLTTPICRAFIRLHVHVDTLTLRYTKLLHLHSCRSSHHTPKPSMCFPLQQNRNRPDWFYMWCIQSWKQQKQDISLSAEVMKPRHSSTVAGRVKASKQFEDRTNTQWQINEKHKGLKQQVFIKSQQ